MTIANGYATVADVKARAESINAMGTAMDAVLEMCIETASRMVDNYCDRRFYTNGTAEVRTYAADSSHILNIDDLAATPVSVKTSSGLDGNYDQTWATTDFQAEPVNRIGAGVAVPYTRLRAVGSYRFPVDAMGRVGVQVTGTFGYGTAVPTQVTHATVLLALRQLKRYESPTGVQGSADFGAVYISRKTDPDVAMILDPLRRYRVAVA